MCVCVCVSALFLLLLRLKKKFSSFGLYLFHFVADVHNVLRLVQLVNAIWFTHCLHQEHVAVCCINPTFLTEKSNCYVCAAYKNKRGVQKDSTLHSCFLVGIYSMISFNGFSFCA